MKIVMVLAVILMISSQASAQKATSKAGASKTTVAKKPAQKAKTPKKTTAIAGIASETAAPVLGESETLASEGNYQAKSRFHWMLAKRIKIDAEDNSNEGSLKPEQRKVAAPVNSRKTATVRSEATKEAAISQKEKSAP